MRDLDMKKELWDLSNIVTGFAVAQALAFALALGNDLAELQSQPVHLKIGIGVVCVVFTVIYCYAVYRFQTLAMSIDTMHEIIWKETTNGRIIAILAFNAISILGLFAPNISECFFAVC